ncbi:cdc42 effector protein 4-like [Tachysurus vachellii]|uniref:cdc42 effector protein 4-like n=1 Tax=Tachysurus vachellii TaxID=175792 RepID=UPI00296AE95D|nr:cdc42 effector protein 4-like [Tachysurus vachellii]
MPILKQLISGSSGSRHRSHADLTVEMISAPLTDFRHTMHIGRGGDAFGDTSFLSRQHESSSQVQKNGILPQRFKGSKRSNFERNSSATSYMLQANSAVSLPYVREHQDVTFHLPQSTSLNFPDMNGKATVMSGWSLEGEKQHFREPSELTMFTPPSSRGMKHAESMLSFHIDLGPSMLGDVLGVMDQTEHDQTDLTEAQRQGRKVSCPIKGVFKSSPGLKEEKTQKTHESETCSPTYSFNINDKDFLFMDEDEDEIRV